MGLDAPVVAVEGQQAGGAGAERGVVGDALDDLGGGLAGLLLERVPFDGEDLSDVGKVEVVVQRGGGPDGAAFDPAMLQGGWLAAVRRTARGEVPADIRAERRLMVLRDEQVMGVAFDQVGGELTLGEQGVSGDGLAGEVDRFEDREGHPDLMGAFQFVAAIDGHGADFFGVWQRGV